ncbi:MAG: FAD binding domain-containing protein [Elusimicrobia bacterium]|nr:FAD binding domain-containing protein [Elusimicrobiota bacterium]
MKNNIKQFCFPTSAKEAASLINRLKSKAVVVAGGTRLSRALLPSVETVVDLADLPLKHIQADKKGLRIGALCSIQSLEVSPLLAKWAGGVIAKAAGHWSNALARSMGTVGGNVARAHPHNNLPPVFLALDAVAVCTDGRREKTIPFTQILEPGLMRALGTRYIVVEVRVPAETRNWSAACARLAITKTSWEAYTNCVVAVEKKDGVVRRASVVVGSVLPRAVRLAESEAALIGKSCGEAAARAAEAAATAELQALTAGAPAKAYACRTSGVLVRRCLLEVFQG